MYGIVFYLKKDILKNEYHKNDDYHQAYEDVRSILRHYGFHWLSNCVYYANTNNNLANAYRAIRKLKELEWFRNALVSFNLFKMSDFSDFTTLIKEGWEPASDTPMI
ncbi:virulence protein [Mycoplasma phocoenae]|uniref:Virulence protein n=1 Tax=Mycoplasma phocoenae TaxID=754517 RepID=A0A858U318_9MOLU|nr:virulence protein [Mycoplasma phocoenae]QJG66870.1 virulence protein [Mycoplasma phocoenae]